MTTTARLAFAILIVPAALTIISATSIQAQAPPAAFPPETEAALHAIVDKHQAKSGAPGLLVGVWVPGTGTFVRAQGVGDVESGAPLGIGDKVRIGSITKTFVATRVLQLVDEGRISLDDSLQTYVRDIPNGERITIRHLLGMTSGVANFLEDPAFLATYDNDLLMAFSAEEALAIARLHAPDFAPGEGFHYSETNYFLLGLIVEQVTGLSVSEAIDTSIAQPLGLSSTLLPTTPALPEPFARVAIRRRLAVAKT